MNQRQWSTADHFAAVLCELNKIKDSYETDDPLRYPISQMARAADKALFDGIRTAADIIEAIRVLRDTLKEEA